jgi:hypothetical protein
MNNSLSAKGDQQHYCAEHKGMDWKRIKESFMNNSLSTKSTKGMDREA